MDYAREKLASVKALFNDLRKSRLTKYLEELESHFNRLKSTTDASDQQLSQQLIGAVRTLLSQGQLDDAFLKLNELKDAVEALSDKATKRAARGELPLTLESAPVLPAPTDRTRINVKTARKDCTTDTQIEFEIIDPQGLLQAGDLFRWNFGESGSQTENGATLAYQYREFGDYNVQVEVLRSNQSVLDLAEPLTVLRGQRAQTVEKILAGIQMNEVILSIVALLLASLTGVLLLYVGKAFGTVGLRAGVLVGLWN